MALKHTSKYKLAKTVLISYSLVLLDSLYIIVL